MKRIKVLRANVSDRAIDLDLHGLVKVMAHSLDLAGLEREDRHLGTSIFECLYGLRQLGFFEAVGGKNGHAEIS